MTFELLSTHRVTWPASFVPASLRVEAASKPPVVLLHSSLSSKQQWNRLVRSLSANHRVITIDLYGYGERRMPESHDDFSLATEIDAVTEQVNEEIGDEPFHLIGHSYGGAIALRLASDHAARIRSLALYEPVAFSLLEFGDTARKEVAKLTAAMHRAMDTDRTEATRLFIDYWSGAGAFARLPEEVKSDFIDRIPKVPLDFQALFGDRLRLADLAALDIPVCLLGGLRSPASTIRITQALALALPNADCHFIDAGHMAPVTHADQVNPILSAFLVHTELACARHECFADDDVWPLLWPQQAAA
jgi:pimeloyl-ACP methyl ester carboxylesterase